MTKFIVSLSSPTSLSVCDLESVTHFSFFLRPKTAEAADCSINTYGSPPARLQRQAVCLSLSFPPPLSLSAMQASFCDVSRNIIHRHSQRLMMKDLSHKQS
jgi:hypothetical protein